MDLPSFAPDPPRYRQVLGHFCTGVTVVAGVDAGEPVGFACQAFAAVSLSPPLVLFCPSVSSTTWPRLARTGQLCVNVLSDDQADLARRFGVSSADKFAGVRWTPAPNGSPVLSGVLTWAACTVESVHEAGDHYVVVAAITAVGDCKTGQPLLFYRSRFAVTAAASPDTAGPAEVVDTLLSWPRYADWI